MITTAVDNPAASKFALMQSIQVCRTHREALQDALVDLEGRRIELSDPARLDKADRRLLDQFAYRYTRLQDDMGTRLIPGILRALGEDVAAMPTVDRLNRMEQLGWLESAEEWSELRQIRNEFTHDYPDGIEERLTRLRLAMASGDAHIANIRGVYAKIAGTGNERLIDDLGKLVLEPTKHDLAPVKQDCCSVKLESFAKSSGK